jgi:hypothetical protein
MDSETEGAVADVIEKRLTHVLLSTLSADELCITYRVVEMTKTTISIAYNQ